MAKINYVKKSRKEYKCSKTGKIIPIGSPYMWISFNYGPTIIRSMEAGFEPWETTSNEYARQVGKLYFDFIEDISSYKDISELESIKDEYLSELENLRDELEDKLSNLPEQFQYSGPGEVINERIDNVNSVIDSLESIDFDMDLELTDDLEEMRDTLLDAGEIDEEDELEESVIKDKYEEYCEKIEEEKAEELSSELEEAMEGLEY